MKVLKNKFSIFNLAGVAALSAVLFFSSCSDDDDNPSNPDQQTNVKVVNGVYDGTDLVVKLNGTQVGPKALAFKNSTDYTAVGAAKSEVTLTVTEQSTNKEILASTLSIAPKANSSLYLVPQTATSAVSTLLITDDFTAPAAGKAKVRLVNLSPDAGSVDLFLNGKAVPSATGIAFKTASPFVEVDPATTANFELRQTGKDNVLVALPNAAVQAGEFTTLWAQGQRAVATAPPLALGKIVNKAGN